MAVLPEFELTDEQRQLRAELERFVDREVRTLDFNEYEWREDPRERVPWQVVDRAGELGLKDLAAPEEYGGMDASALTLTMAVEELAVGDLGLAVLFDQTWKISRIVAEMADDDLRDRFFEEFVADPRHVLAITLTEPANGTNYVVDYEGMRFDTVAEKDGDEWVIDGHKHFISNGADAKTYVVFAQTDPDVPAQRGTTAFLVPEDAEGLEVTHIHEKISQRLVNNATIEFHGVRVPEGNVLGEVNRGKTRTGEVLKESHIEAGASVLGVARAAFEDAYEYAHDRVQGGKPIVEHQAIGHDFAGMATDIQAARSLLWTAARAVDEQGERYNHVYGHMAKIFAADVAVDVTERALTKFGGSGIMLDYPVQKYHRDALSFQHSDGTQEAHRENVLKHLPGV
ncbi:MAG: acyl-CoA dehydrogenase family protein [Salinigranum sp.]